MKKSFFIVLIFAVLLSFSGCASLIGEPSLEGIWYCDGIQYSFTSDGYYVLEEDSYAEIGTYEKTETTVIIDGYEYDYIIEGKTLILGYETYTRKTNKATNNTSKIYGVWSNDERTIGFSKDGLVFASGIYYNYYNGFTADNGLLTANSKTAEYIIINDTLYIEDWKFIGSYETVILTRQTSEGKNQTSSSVLCAYGPWFYQSDSYNGTSYYFKSNGTFSATKYVSGSATSTFSGTWSLSQNKITTSQGSNLSFAIIDDHAFGYSM